ncbi:splicing factor 3B subunit 2 [Trichonephila clavipes]|nr:splicing factor 3B subunit 2 [Trichonephila clavipes]
MAFLGKGSKVDLQYMATEMGIEDVLGIRVFELRDAILNSEYFDEEFRRELLNTIIEERERKEEIELDERKRKEDRELVERKIKEEIELAERKRKEEMELAERKRKEEMEVAERKKWADFEQRMRDVEMEFETQKKLIELEGGHFTRACLDVEVSTDRGTIGNEVRSNISSETRLKVEVEDKLKADKEAKAVEEGRKMEEERRMNERIALEGEMRLKKERGLVKEQMRHVQEEHKTSMKEERKCLPEERCKRMNVQNQLLNEGQEKLSDEDTEVTQAIKKVLVSKGEQIQTRSADQYAVAQSVVVEKDKEERNISWCDKG